MKASRVSIVRNLYLRYDETKLIKAVFFGMLTGVIVTLGLDYRELQRQQIDQIPSATRQVPVLPSALPSDGTPNGQSTRPDVVTTPAEIHRNAMTINLGSAGVLELKGSITDETAALFLEKIDQIGEYVEVIALDSPGGFLESALTIGNAIRENGFQTKVVEGALCASACPIIFAGGTIRAVDEKAAFGLHQIYSVRQTQLSSAEAMASAQATTARITRYLETMGVDPAVWTFALETPPERLYYLSDSELSTYKFVN